MALTSALSSAPVSSAAYRARTGDRRLRKVAFGLLIGHLMALMFGLAGLLIAIPNPDLWADSSFGPKAFDFGMKYGGSLHIIFGAAAMFAYGMYAIGFRKTAIFFACAVPISLGSELMGTSTGEPFGNYSYTNFLGYKLFDHVPYSIPLSWFYVGFATMLIGYELARRLPFSPRWLHAIIFGSVLLVAWDLVLDPAMAHQSLTVRFWEWGQTGPYFGMPLQNFFGWGMTAFIFMTVARLVWRSDPPHEVSLPWMWFPVAVFVANIFFASALSISVDLWIPVGFAVVLGLLPTAIVFTRWGLNANGEAESISASTSQATAE